MVFSFLSVRLKLSVQLSVFDRSTVTVVCQEHLGTVCRLDCVAVLIRLIPLLSSYSGLSLAKTVPFYTLWSVFNFFFNKDVVVHRIIRLQIIIMQLRMICGKYCLVVT